MSLTDLMSGANLAIYPQIALVIFLVVFIAVAIMTFKKGSQPLWERARQMPLEDDVKEEASR